MINKYYKDGKVGVLVSPGFGAGWSTWASGGTGEEMVFDADIVKLVLDGADTATIKAKAEEKWPSGYFGGACDLEVYWVDPGTAFEISEYDGSESLRIIGQIEYYVA